VKPLAVAAAALFSLRMGRPRKAAKASRANGAQAKNKGKAVNVKEECFGGYSPVVCGQHDHGSSRDGQGRGAAQ
jgi:hypothetical protein